MKNGQVTLFIILGIVVLIIAIFVLYISNWSKMKSLNDKNTEVGKLPSDLQPLVSYMDTCVEKIAKDGLVLLGKQGGAIYRSQGGKTSDYDEEEIGYVFLYYPTQETRVIYLIDKPSAGSNKCVAEPKGYPVGEFKPFYPYDTDSIHGGPKLDSKIYKQPRCFGKASKLSITSIINNLKSYVENKIKTECSTSLFKNYRFAAAEPIASIDVLPSSISVFVSYPITATNVNTEAKTTLSDYKATLSINIKDLVEFINMINQEDSDDPVYDITTGSEGRDYLVSRVRDVYNKDDIIMISSVNLKLNGEPFNFIYARKNRYPVLEYLYDVSFEGVPLQENFHVTWQDVIKQELAGADPDEDEINFRVWFREGNTKTEMLKEGEFEISGADVDRGRIPIKIEAFDGELADYEDFMIE